MSIRKRLSKRSKNGYVYEVNFTYKENGITMRHFKSGFQTKKEAQDYEILKKSEIHDEGKLIKNTKKTLSEVYEEFLEIGSSRYQPATIYGTKKCYHYFEKELGKIPIKSIDYTLLQKYFNNRKNEGIETNKSIKKAISRILNYAIRAGYIKSNPLNLVAVIGVDRHMEHNKILSHEDFSALIQALNDIGDFRYQAYAIAIQIGYYTGLRISEVLALSKEDIDFEKNMIFINKKLFYKGLKKEEYIVSSQMKSKTSKSEVPLANVLKTTLIEWFTNNPYDKVICDSEGYYLNPNVLSIQVKKVANKLGIQFHFHMLRHTFSTNIVTNQVDLKTAQELMRHSHINTTMSIYTHLNNQHKIDVINTVFKTECGENVANTTTNKNNQI